MNLDPAIPVGPRWRPIAAIDRRVLGVLVEKAKTTPDVYPMSLNALTTGCNQKNNREPHMQLTPDDVTDSLDRLRGLHAVVEIHGDSRVARYKHLMYEWLGVDKVEMAVMTELLLRGAQTIGELRGRAARMEPIADLGALRPVLDALATKGLVEYLTPPQRGAVVTHMLYLPDEIEKVRRIHAAAAEAADPGPVPPPRPMQPPAAPRMQPPPSPTSSGAAPPAGGASAGEIAGLKNQVRELSDELRQLRSTLESTTSDLRRDVDDLKRQLGI
ncbi:MAG: YceH family protein [Planctomycetia bacterium]|nr:YceH family protein [Planctomycetia bacterium]